MLAVKNLPVNAGDIRDVGLIPETGRSPGGVHDPSQSLQNQPQTIKKMAIGTYISIITLNVNGLNSPTRRQTG